MDNTGDPAVHVVVAARNNAEAKKKAEREQADDDDSGLDGLPPSAIPEGEMGLKW